MARSKAFRASLGADMVAGTGNAEEVFWDGYVKTGEELNFVDAVFWVV